MSRLTGPPRTTAPPPLGDSLGRLPDGTRVYDRVTYLIERTRDRSVIHLGFVDARNMSEKVDRSTWLHAQLSQGTRRLVGIDSDQEGIRAARELGHEAHLADCQNAEEVAELAVTPADLVLAAEIIEHLDRPGDFLDAVRQLIAPGGELVITTPNPTSLTNVLLALRKTEVQNADHVGWHSWRTLDTLLGRHGYRREAIAFYRHPRFVASRRDSLPTRVRCSAFNAYQAVAWPLFAAAPSLADGLIVVARPEPDRA